MLKKYIKLEEFLQYIEDTHDHLLSGKEKLSLNNLINFLEKCNSVTIPLQNENVNLFDARALFDAIVLERPSKSYIMNNRRF